MSFNLLPLHHMYSEQEDKGPGRRQTRHSTDPEIEIKFNKSCKIASSSEDNLPQEKETTSNKSGMGSGNLYPYFNGYQSKCSMSSDLDIKQLAFLDQVTLLL